MYTEHWVERVTELSKKKMTQPKQRALIFQLGFLFLLLFVSVGRGQSLPPARPDGFVYGKKHTVDWDSIMIEAFFDPVCPDSRDSWPPLKQALAYYGDRVRLIVHLLPLPYHDNAFVASRALHIVNNLNTSATFLLLESFFKHQKKFYNVQTRNLSRASVVSEIVKFASESVGNSYYSALESGFNDRKTDLKTRVSFKYSASRGVYGTPFFFINGFQLPDTGSGIDFNGWKSFIDPLIGSEATAKSEDNLHFFL